jgi:hypothetical protein
MSETKSEAIPLPGEQAFLISLGELKFLIWLLNEGFRDVSVTPLAPGRWAAIQPKMFTHAIVIGDIGDYDCIGDGWCYHDYATAKAALDAWDGQGEPVGWFRHPASGRRVAEVEGERDADGRVVMLGELYQRW